MAQHEAISTKQEARWEAGYCAWIDWWAVQDLNLQPCA